MNIHVSVVDSAEFKTAEPVDQATWFKLLRFCCGQENGGVIEKAAALGDRQWQNMVCCTMEEVQRQTGLWEWADGDLVVNFYSPDHEKRTRAQRKAAINTNRKRNAQRDAKRLAQRDANRTERNVTEQNSSENGGGQGHFPESVSDDVVIAFGKSYPGEMATGTPAMAAPWVLEFLRKINGRREWPRDWRRLMVSSWRSEWRMFGEAARPGNGFEKNGAKKCGEVSASVKAIQDGNRRKEIGGRLRELNEEIESLHGVGAPVAAELTQEETGLRRELAMMGGAE